VDFKRKLFAARRKVDRLDFGLGGFCMLDQRKYLASNPILMIH